MEATPDGRARAARSAARVTRRGAAPAYYQGLMAAAAMVPAAPVAMHPLTRDFLTWLAACPRTYGETMEVWRTSCPRFSIWEDALEDGLVRLERAPGVSFDEAAVAITERGLGALQREEADADGARAEHAQG